MDPNKEFGQNLNQLVELLKKILSNLPGNLPNKEAASFLQKGSDSNVNLNFCFFNLVPMTEEELSELEDIYEQMMGNHPEDKAAAEIKSDLTLSDLEFLKKHGIRF